MAADDAYGQRFFQFAITALQNARNCNVEIKNIEKIGKIDKRIESIKAEMPHNFEECFAELKKQLTAKQLEGFKNQKTSDLIKYHRNLGMWIRNSWGLWAN